MGVNVAFLRAINVGKRRVSMERLREPFEELGFAGVTTFIASGNVIFTAAGKAPDLEARIEAALTEALGFEVVTFVRAAGSIARIAEDHPFAGSGELAHVGFLKRAPGAAARRAVEALGTETDTLAVRGKAVYWLPRSGMGRATVSGAAVEKALGAPTTFRGVKMLKRLAAKLG